MKNKNVPKIRFKGFSEEWEENLLINLVTFNKGRGYTKNDLVEKGNPIILYGRLYTQYETSITNVNTFVAEHQDSVLSRGGEVIVPASGETPEDIARASVVCDPNIILGGDLNILSPYTNINSIFLALSISSGEISRELSRKAQGKSVVHLRNNDLAEINLLYPSIDEQTHIGNFFQSIDNLINLNQKKLDKLKNLKKASLEKMFPKQGATTPEIRFKGFSEEWEERRLGEIGEFRSNGVDKKIRVNEQSVYLLNYMDVYNRRKTTSKTCNTLMQVTATKEQINNNNILENDVFFTPSSETSDDIGRVMFISETLPNTVYSYHLIRYRPKENYFVPFFPDYGFTCSYIRKQMILEAQGVQRFVINKRGFENLRILIPEIKEQKQITSYFRSLDKLIDKQQAQLTKLKNLKKACLDKMFVTKDKKQ